MLKNLDPLLHADILHTLRAMGHGDEIAICDANFPAESVAEHTVVGRALRIDGADSARVVRAVLSVLPLDTFVDTPRGGWKSSAMRRRCRPCSAKCRPRSTARKGARCRFAGIDRFAFYERAQQAYAVIVTGELRGYGCFIFKKGVLLSDAG